MAKVVDVTDVPELPGAGMLHFDDGRPPLMALPEIADEHRERLGLNALDNGVAGPGSGTPDGGGFMSKLWNGQLDSQKNLNAQVPLGGKLAQPSAPQPAPAAPAAPVTAPPPAPVPQQGADGATPAPAAPVDPAQAAQDERLRQIQLTGRLPGGGGGPARPAGFSPDIQKTVTEHGPAYDPQAAGERLDAGAAVLDAQLAKAATEKQIADATAARAAAQNLQAQQSLAHQQAEVQRKQANFQAQEKGFQNDIDRYTQSAQPDPNHFIASRGVVANIFGAIGQGLGAFGASLNHTQNYAFDYVQSQIKADIAAQEERYRAGRADKKDALARFVDYYHGDMDMAKAAMLQAQNKVAETETNNFAAQAQSKEVSANAQVLAAQFQQQQLLAEQQRAELAAGKTTTTTEDKFHQASGGTGGGKPLTLAEELAIKKAAGSGKPALSATGEARQKANYGTKIEQTERFTDALAHEAKLMGVQLDPETGTIIDPKTGKPAQAVDVPVGAGALGQHLPGMVVPKGATDLRRARINSARLHSSAILGKDLSADEGEKEADKTLGQTDAERLDSLRQRAHELYAYRRSLDATAASIDPSIVNSRTQAQKDVNLSRATGKPLPESPRGAAEPDAPEPELP
jgi:hypothetical protein